MQETVFRQPTTEQQPGLLKRLGRFVIGRRTAPIETTSISRMTVNELILAGARHDHAENPNANTELRLRQASEVVRAEQYTSRHAAPERPQLFDWAERQPQGVGPLIGRVSLGEIVQQDAAAPHSQPVTLPGRLRNQ